MSIQWCEPNQKPPLSSNMNEYDYCEFKWTGSVDKWSDETKQTNKKGERKHTCRNVRWRGFIREPQNPLIWHPPRIEMATFCPIHLSPIKPQHPCVVSRFVVWLIIIQEISLHAGTFWILMYMWACKYKHTSIHIMYVI